MYVIDIKETAEEIRSCYLQMQKKLHNGNFRLSERFDNPKFWTKAAQVCKQFRYSPDLFVAKAFDLIDIITETTKKRGFSMLTPCMLYSKPFINELRNDIIRNKNVAENVNYENLTNEQLRKVEIKTYVNDCIRFFNNTVKCLEHNGKGRMLTKIITMKAYAFPGWLRFYVSGNEYDKNENLIKNFTGECLYELNNIPGLKEELEERKGKTWVSQLAKSLITWTKTKLKIQ